MPQGVNIREDHHPRSRQHAEGAAAGHGGSQQAGNQKFCEMLQTVTKEVMSEWASLIY